jgi:hypothetical protein
MRDIGEVCDSKRSAAAAGDSLCVRCASADGTTARTQQLFQITERFALHLEVALDGAVGREGDATLNASCALAFRPASASKWPRTAHYGW